MMSQRKSIFDTICQLAREQNTEALTQYLNQMNERSVDILIGNHTPASLLTAEKNFDAVEFLILRFGASTTRPRLTTIMAKFDPAILGYLSRLEKIRLVEPTTKIIGSQKEPSSRYNNTVFIRDILVVQDDWFLNASFGEYYQKNIITDQHINLIDRMFAHIESIATHAKKIHLNDHADESGDIKINKLNLITRVTFQEFHFYPSLINGALSISDFQSLIEQIERLASTLPVNMHFVFASFPLIDEQQRLHNMVIHIQSGINPTIHTFAKSNVSHIDKKYHQATLTGLTKNHIQGKSPCQQFFQCQ